MFSRFNQLNLASKLNTVILCTCVFAVLSVSVTTTILEIKKTKKLIQKELETLATGLKEAGQESLAMAQLGPLQMPAAKELAERLLDFSDRSEILSACFFNANGGLYAAYTRPGLPMSMKNELNQLGNLEAGAHEGKEGVRLVKRIYDSVNEGEFLGSVHLAVDRSTLHAHASQVLATNILVITAVAFGIIGISRRLSILITKPVKHLVETTDHITKCDDYTARARKFSADELGDLTDCFNTMLRQIQTRDNQLKDAYSALESRITELKSEKAERQVVIEREKTLLKRLAESQRMRAENLETKKDKAESASSAKSQFVANMSHEIRNPLSGLIGMLQLLERQSMSGRCKSLTLNALSSAESLLNVIGDVLDLSKIEAGKIIMEQRPFEIRKVIDSAVRLFAERAEKNGLELTYHVELGVPEQMVGDSHLLRQVLLNLIGNAIKFSQKGVVFIKCTETSSREKESEIEIQVIDSGIGIANADHERIFNRFSQANSSMPRAHAGTGLGLPICRQICQKMGGSIGVKSRLNQGSTFWIRLPFAQDDGATDSPSKEHDLFGMRVLIAEQYKETRKIIVDYITKWNGEVSIAEDWRHALDALQVASNEGSPYLIAYIDDSLPGFSFPKLIDAKIRNPGLQQTKFLLITKFSGLGHPGQDSQDIAVSIAKPLSESVLFDSLQLIQANPALQSERKENANDDKGPSDSWTIRGKILVVEDNEVNRHVVVEMLTDLGYQSICVSNGRQALQTLESSQFDLVLMDCQMPLMDGYEATKRIRESESSEGDNSKKTRRLPIVALTAHAVVGDRETCLDAGMDDYLTKPLNPQLLKRTLDKWIAPTQKDRNIATGNVESNSHAQTLTGFNLQALLGRCKGKKERVIRLLNEYLKQAAADIDTLEESVRNESASGVKVAAHRLNGASKNLSAAMMSATAEELEFLGEHNHFKEAAVLVAWSRKQLGQMEAELHNFCAITTASDVISRISEPPRVSPGSLALKPTPGSHTATVSSKGPKPLD